MSALVERLEHFLKGFEFRSTGKWFLLSATIGVVAGLGAIAFQLLGQGVAWIAMGWAAGYVPREAAGEHAFFHSWFGAPGAAFSMAALITVMVLGGLLSGWLVYRFAPEAEGHGTDAAIDSFHRKGGRVRARVPLIKTLASAITLGTGGSGGREGPIAQIGSGFGSNLATLLKLSSRDRRILMAAGMGAGVGAIFRAPLAGALFAGEIFYRDAEFETEAIVPAAIASCVAYSVYGAILPDHLAFLPIFGAGLDFHLSSALELLPMTLLAVLLTLAGILYIKCFYGMRKLFQRLPTPRMLNPALGVGCAGLLAALLLTAFDGDLAVLAVLSTGYGAIQAALDPTQLSIALLLTIALGKIVTTSLTISSGGSGGVFGPSMVIGGCVGAAVGRIFHDLWPELVPQAGVYVIVGMAGFFSGCAHAPFSTILMVSEMTGHYRLLLPTMWVCTLCFLLCRRWTLYEKQVPTRLDSPAHRGDFWIDLLEDACVRDVFSNERKLRLVAAATPMAEVIRLLSHTEQNYFPVVDEEQRMVGIFSANDVRRHLFDADLFPLAIAGDVMESAVVSVTLDHDLNTALRRFTDRNLDELPVVDARDAARFLGFLRRRDVIAFYNQRLEAERTARAAL